jgi:hypothetical protein
MSKDDPRRFYPIEVCHHGDHIIHLMIYGVMWSEVEWSPQRRAWCIQDASGHCLLHCESIVEQDDDEIVAIDTAKRMIRDGSMPTPEEAHAAHEERQLAKELGEPIRQITKELGEPMPILNLVDVQALPIPRERK